MQVITSFEEAKKTSERLSAEFDAASVKIRSLGIANRDGRYVMTIACPGKRSAEKAAKVGNLVCPGSFELYVAGPFSR